MARPRKTPVSESQSEEILSEAPATEREPARETIIPEPVPYTPPPVIQPRNLRIERQGERSEPFVHHYPQVRGGICDWCGVLDRNVPSQFQYKLCPHYRGMQLMCSYCPGTKDPNDVIYKSLVKVMDSPGNPGELIVVCDNFECESKHQKRFQRSNS